MFQYRLRRLRKKAGFESQKAFADDFGVAELTVNDWETGNSMPNDETLRNLARFLNVSVEYLRCPPGIPDLRLDDSQQEKIYNLLNSKCRDKGLTHGEVITLTQVSNNFFPRLSHSCLHQISEYNLFSVATCLGVQEDVFKIVSEEKEPDLKNESILNMAQQVQNKRLSSKRNSAVKIAAKGQSDHDVEMDSEQTDTLKQALAQLPND